VRLAIMQPYLFPYIGYFQLMNAVDKFIIFDKVNYIKRGWINRNRILVNGKSKMFTIPLKKSSQNKIINEIEILTDNNWKGKLLKTIQYNYKKSPFYCDIFPLIEAIILHDESNLSCFIQYSIKILNDYLGINVAIVTTDNKYFDKQLNAEQKVIEICLQEKAQVYVNPINGANLYSKQLFDDYNIQLFFIKPCAPDYNQFGKNFVPWLSIIDVMMFNSLERIKEMLNKFELVQN
jgi:hypothetical protein